MNTMGQQEGIEKVRIYSSDGKILFSTDKSEVGRMVDQRGEACYGCHSEARPLGSVGSIVAICVIVALVLIHFFTRPVKELVLGTHRISGGDLDHFIPVATNDEMGHLASSFNQMTRDLQKANAEVREGIRTLEQKVEEGTQERQATPSPPMRSGKLPALAAVAATVAHE